MKLLYRLQYLANSTTPAASALRSALENLLSERSDLHNIIA